MVAENDEKPVPAEADPNLAPDLAIDDQKLEDAQWVRQELAASMAREAAALLGGGATALAIREEKYRTSLTETYQDLTGQKLSRVTSTHRDSIERVVSEGFLAQQEASLADFEAALDTAEGLTTEKKRRLLTPAKKRRLLALARRTLALQKRARSHPLLTWAYVGEPQEEPGQALRFTELDRRIWKGLTSKARGRLIEIHPESGKSYNIVGLLVGMIPRHPHYRILLLFGTTTQAEKTLQQIRGFLNSPRFQALYPGCRILGRAENAKNTAKRFRVSGAALGAREYTIEAVSGKVNIQGDRYDWIVADDYCPPEVVEQDKLRDTLNKNFFRVVLRRLAGGNHTRVFYICTPWHEDDTAGLLAAGIRKGRRPDWEQLILPVTDDPDTGLAISLCPSRWPVERYEAEKLNPETDYDRMFRLRVISERDQVVKKVWYYPSNWRSAEWALQPEDWRKTTERRLRQIARGRRILSVDWASSRQDYSSETALVAAFLTPEGPLYVHTVDYMPGSAPDLERCLLRHICGPQLFDLRWMPQDATEETRAAIRKRREARVPAEGDTDQVIIDAQGNQKGGVQLFRLGILRALEEMGIVWNGSIDEQNTQGVGGGQHLGKKQRLRAVAAHVEGGAVQFRGNLHWDSESRQYVYDEPANEGIARLASEVLNPVGRLDGLDAFTQMVIKLFHLIHAPIHAFSADRPEPKPEELTYEQKLIRRMIQGMARQTGGRGEFGKELEWISSQVA